MLIVVPLALTACSESIGSVEAPVLADPPLGLTTPCKGTVTLPKGELTQSQVEAYWITDRERLVRCGIQLQHLIAFYTDRDSRITEL